MENKISLDRVEDLILRFLNQELVFEEEKELFSWINESREHYILFDKYRETAIAASQISDNAVFKPELAWEKIEKAGNINLANNASIPRSGIIIHLKKILRVAAIIAISFSVGYTSSLFLNKSRTKSDKITEVTAPLGSKSNITLPDGTMVWLNSGSKISYSKSFNENDRHLVLQGEAFFKVFPDKKKPFIVHTPHMDIKALGTAFNVKAYPEDKTSIATLVEGSIKVDIKGKDLKQVSYTLKPNQNITIVNELNKSRIDYTDGKSLDSAQLMKPELNRVIPAIQLSQKVSTELYTSWKDSRWILKGESLGSLAKLLERRFNVKIHLMSDKLNAYKFTGTIQNETLEQVLQYLKLTAPVRCEIGKGEVWWYTDSMTEQEYYKLLNK